MAVVGTPVAILIFRSRFLGSKITPSEIRRKTEECWSYNLPMNNIYITSGSGQPTPTLAGLVPVTYQRRTQGFSVRHDDCSRALNVTRELR